MQQLYKRKVIALTGSLTNGDTRLEKIYREESADAIVVSDGIEWLNNLNYEKQGDADIIA
ncbi:hypothetical protein [Virgibacillus sp. YIM 98842]|uniref:hypothetical protein n=1 Tax=Virgibacillus sp. YIM 98842 TaxID=2663533 RepID=UPI0013DC58E0|nr:hypothetical protein [Virgibacillus sp. YIM 98842]